MTLRYLDLPESFSDVGLDFGVELPTTPHRSFVVLYDAQRRRALVEDGITSHAQNEFTRTYFMRRGSIAAELELQEASE